MPNTVFFSLKFEGVKQSIESIAALELELNKLNKEMRDAKKSNDTEKYTSLSVSVNETKTAIRGLRAEQRQLQKTFDDAKYPSDSLKGLQREYANLTKEIRTMSKAQLETADGAAKVARAGGLKKEILQRSDKIGDFTPNIGNYRSAISGLTASFGGAGLTGAAADAFGSLSAYNSGIASGVPKIAAYAAALIALSDQFSAGFTANVEYNKSLKQLQALTGVSGDALKKFEEQAAGLTKIKIGSQTFSTDAKSIIEAMQKVGGAQSDLLKDPAALAAVTKDALVLARASGETTAETVNVVTLAMGAFNLKGEESARVVNALAAGTKEGAAEMSDLAPAFKNSAVASAAFNVSIEENVAALETLAERGFKGAEAGTALRTLFTKMASAKILPEDAQTVLKNAGVNIQILTDKTLPLSTRLKEVAKFGGDVAASQLVFGEEAAKAAQILSNAIPKYESLKTAITGTNTAYVQAEINASSQAAQIENLKLAYNEARNAVVEFITAALVPLGTLLLNIGRIFVSIPAAIYENRVAILSLGAAYAAYNATQIAALARTVANNIATKVDTAVKIASAFVTDGLTAAQERLNAAIQRNPIGLLVSVAILAISTLTSFSSATATAAEATSVHTQKANEQTFALRKVQTELNAEFDLLKQGNLTKAEKAMLIGEINAKYGEYLPKLIQEGDSLGVINKLQAEVNKGIEERILLYAYEASRANIIDTQTKATQELANANGKLLEARKKAAAVPEDRDVQRTVYSSKTDGQRVVTERTSDKFNANREVADRQKEVERITKATQPTAEQLAQMEAAYELTAKQLGSGLDKIKKAYGKPDAPKVAANKDYLLPDKSKKGEKGKSEADYIKEEAQRIDEQLKRIAELNRKIRDLAADNIKNVFDKGEYEAKAKELSELDKVAERRRTLDEKIVKDKEKAKALGKKYSPTNADKEEAALIETDASGIVKATVAQLETINEKRAKTLEDARQQVLGYYRELKLLAAKNIDEAAKIGTATVTNRRTTTEAKTENSYLTEIGDIKTRFAANAITKKEYDQLIFDAETRKIDALQKANAAYFDYIDARSDEALNRKRAIAEQETEIAIAAIRETLRQSEAALAERKTKGEITGGDADAELVAIRETAAERIASANIKKESDITDAVNVAANEQIAAQNAVAKSYEENASRQIAANERLITEEARRKKQFEEIGLLALDIAQKGIALQYEITQQNADKQKEKALKNIDEEGNARLKLVSGNALLEAGIRAEIEAEKEATARKYFEADKRRKIEQAGIDGLLGVVRAFATSPDPFTAAFTAAASVAASVLAIAKIESSSFAEGGITGRATIGTKRDATGEKPVNATVHEGELIIRRRFVEAYPAWSRQMAAYSQANDLQGFSRAINAPRGGYSPRIAPFVIAPPPNESVNYNEMQLSDRAVQQIANATRAGVEAGVKLVEQRSIGLKNGNY